MVTAQIAVGRSDTPAYGQLLAAVEAGAARYVGEHIDPLGVKVVAVDFGHRPNPTIGISQAFFTTVLRDYDDWRQKWWREAIQNAVDARATQIDCQVVTEADGTVVVSCTDNGGGMTEDVLLNKFLMLGATTKPAVEGMAGGFGKAKELLILPWLSWQVHSRDRVASGSGLTYEVGPAPHLQGTRITVRMPADQHTSTAAAIAFIRKCNLPRVKFSVREVGPHGETTESEPRARLRGTRVLEEIPGKAEVSTAKVDYNGVYIYVRVRGLFMFEEYVGTTKGRQLICEITAPSVEILTANRDGFRDPQVRRTLRELSERIAKDVMSAFRKRSGLVRQKYAGTGKFAAERRTADTLASMGPIGPRAGGRVDLDVGAVELISSIVESYREDQEIQTQRQAALPNRGLAVELLRSVDFLGAHHVEEALRQLVWEPDFFLINEIEGWRVPKRFRPETMGARPLKLARTWTELCRFVLMQLGNYRPFGVGWLFSEDMAAAYQNDDEEHWLLLNPFKDICERKAIWSPSRTDDLRWLYAAAVHECTHLADGIDYHDEAFAAALTRNIARTADGFRKVRGIARAVRTSDRPVADIQRNPASTRRVDAVLAELLAY